MKDSEDTEFLGVLPAWYIKRDELEQLIQKAKKLSVKPKVTYINGKPYWTFDRRTGKWVT